MKKLILAAAACAALRAQSGFEAAAAKRIITPDPLLPIIGGMGPGTPAKSKQGDLTARALVVRAHGETVAIVSVDLLGLPSVLGDRARAKVPRLKPEQILIGATHTHSAPDTYAFPDGKGPDGKGGHTGSLDYMRFVTDQIAAAINDALDHMRPAEIRVASGEVRGRVAYNYYAPDLYDRRAGVIQIRGIDGRSIATLVNYAVHPEVLGSRNAILSPDLVGPLNDALGAAGGIGLFLNGAQGGMITADNRNLDQAPRDAARAYWTDSRTWSECERIGRLLASESVRIIESAPWKRDARVANLVRRVRFPVDSPELWSVIEHSPLGYPHTDRAVHAQINLVTLGDARILTIPGEALPNIGFYLKRRMKTPNAFLFGLTNDAFGYILTKVDFDSFPAYRYISRTSLGEMTGEILIRNAEEMIEASR